MSRGQANLLTTGALGRRVAQIARLLPKGPSWSRTGQPLDMSHVIWGILADVQRHAKARRGLQAGEALKRAEELVRANRATIREAKRRELEEAAAERRAEASRRGNQKKRRDAADQATPYITEARRLRNKYEGWSRESIITEIRRRDPFAPAARTLRTWLRDAGVK